MAAPDPHSAGFAVPGSDGKSTHEAELPLPAAAVADFAAARERVRVLDVGSPASGEDWKLVIIDIPGRGPDVLPALDE